MHYIAGFFRIYNIKNFRGWYPELPQCEEGETQASRPNPKNGQRHIAPKHQFPMGSPAFPMLLFYETITAARGH